LRSRGTRLHRRALLRHRRRAARLRAGQLLLELAVAVLELLDHAGELAHLAFQPVEPRHEFGFGHLRARGRDNDHARQYRRHERTRKKSGHGLKVRRLASRTIRIAASKL
jgi:hypothetical protein